MRLLTATLALLVAGAVWAEPPKVPDKPQVVPVGQDFPVEIKAPPEAVVIDVPGFPPRHALWFPGREKKDGTRVYLFRPYQEGTYRVSFLVKGEDEYSHYEFVTTADPGPVKPPPPPGGGDDPVKPPPAPAAGLYFLVVRADGPAAPSFTKVMEDPAWDALRKQGHKIKDKTVTEAASPAIGVTLPSGTVLPAVVTLQVSADGKQSTIVRPAVPLPTTSVGITDLPKGVKGVK